MKTEKRTLRCKERVLPIAQYLGLAEFAAVAFDGDQLQRALKPISDLKLYLRYEFMQCPRVKIAGKTVILLSGYRLNPVSARGGRTVVESQAIRKLRQAVLAHPDALAFGLTAGQWVPAA